MARDAENYISALKDLGYLPQAEVKAEEEFNRILGLIETDENDLREIAAHADDKRENALDAKTALAIVQIDRLAGMARELEKEEKDAPRLKVVREHLEMITRKALNISNALDDRYVLKAIALEESSAGNLIKELRRLSESAAAALQQRELIFIRGSWKFEDGALALGDTGGGRKATRLYRLPAKQHFIGLCLGVFNQHRQGATANVEGPFARFAQWVWRLGTNEETDLKKPIQVVFSLIKTVEGAPIDKILALKLLTEDRDDWT